MWARIAKLIERVSYDAYGKARHHRAADLNGDGAVGVPDQLALQASWEEYGVGDLTRNGIVGDPDLLFLLSAWNAALPEGQLSITDNIIGFAGYVFNAEHAGGGLCTVRFRVYLPDLGRWITRDPLGYVDGMGLYEYVRSQPLRLFDPLGLTSCMDECWRGCPSVPISSSEADTRYKKAVAEHGVTVFYSPTKECTRRCSIACGPANCNQDLPCTPKGRLTWGSPSTVPGKSSYSFTIRIDGEDEECCSEFGIVQFVRQNGGKWTFDDGRKGLLSDRSPVPPYYDPPVKFRFGRGWLTFDDSPGGTAPTDFDFSIAVICTDGPAAGHLYGVYKWSVSTGWSLRRGTKGNSVDGPSGAPGTKDDLPEFMNPCCEK